MINDLKFNDVKKIFPKREKNSHKGVNGRVLIVGGSEFFHGAPVLSALGALNSGADLVYLMVPEDDVKFMRAVYPDFIINPFYGSHFSMKSVELILQMAAGCDVILIGPGIGSSEDTQEAILHVIKNLRIPTILDGEAIQVFQKIKDIPYQPIVITPHHNEFENLTGKEIKIESSLSSKVVLIRTIATDLKLNILLKGPQDLIASEGGDVVSNLTGNAGMTVGGSGDVLSGIVASLIGQGATTFEALKIASFVFGKTGEDLFKEKGYCFSASDLAGELGFVFKGFY